MRWFFLLGLMLTSSAHAQEKLHFSQFRSGNDLHQSCIATVGGDSTLIDFGLCMGYIQGVSDAYLMWRSETAMASCYPSGVTGKQIKDLVIAYLTKHPEERHLSGATSVIKAIEPLLTACT